MSLLSTTPPASRTQHMLTPRAVLTGLIVVIIVATLGLLLVYLTTMSPFGISLSVVGLLLFAGLLAVHLHGWRYSPHATVVAAAVFTVVGNPADITTRQLSFTVLIPAMLAAMFLPWYWTIASFLICIAGIGVQSNFAGPLFRPDSMLLALVVVVGAAAAGAFGRSAQHAAEVRAELLADEKGRVEAQAHELAEANQQMNIQLDQQRQLLDLITTLETPVIQLADGVLLAPIVGHLDSRRTQALTTRLLQDSHTLRAKHVILDIAGVPIVDTQVAHALVSATQALQLLGCTVTVSSISADVAITLTHLGIALEGIATVRSPQEALAQVRYVAQPLPNHRVN